MVAVGVSDEKVKNGSVDQVEEAVSLVVGLGLFQIGGAIFFIRLPPRLLVVLVRALIRMANLLQRFCVGKPERDASLDHVTISFNYTVKVTVKFTKLANSNEMTPCKK